MADVVGVVFHDGLKTYNFDPAGLELSRGDRVVVQTMRGIEIGQVVDPPHVVDDSELPAPLKKVMRLATGSDLEIFANSQGLRKEAMATCRRLIASHGLDMKLVSADVSFGGEKITFNFYSDERVDFRALVADLAKTLKMRIELRQIGAREEARLVGGLGPCGRHLCCTLFAGDDEPVSIRMAKEQNLPLNPMKISGLCGRLMCCLKYEQAQYVKFRKEAPSRGTLVKTPGGDGVITGYNVPKDAIVVRLEDGTYSDIRLASCESQEDGTLVLIPEVVEPVLSEGELEPRGVDAAAESKRVGGDSATAVEEVGLGANGESAGAEPSEGRGNGAGRSRSRRSRSSRQGRTGESSRRRSGDQQRDTPPEREAGTSGQAQRGVGRGSASGPGRRQGQDSAERPTGCADGPAGESGGDDSSSGGVGGERRPRRRRKPRRSRGKSGESAASEGSTGASAGEASGASVD